MNVLGYSGLNYSEMFRQREVEGLEKRHTRICQGYDSAAAFVASTGVVAAAAEERFVRKKATGAFPINSLRYCLQIAEKDMAAIDAVAHGFNYSPYQHEYEVDDFSRSRYDEVYSRNVQLALLNEHFPEIPDWSSRMISVPHHLAHAASTFYPSGFDEALIVVADGMGEHESLTVATGAGSEIKILKQIPSINSLGILYSVFTMYLGFEFNMDEYKVMGLAPYGNARRFFNQVKGLVTLHEDGTHTIPLLFRNKTEMERETYAASIEALVDMFGPERKPESEITQIHKDIAAALQATLQNAMLHLLRSYQESTGADRLVMAGGVALNCTANGVVKRSGLFKDSFVQPAAGDDGTALGAALHVRNQRGGHVGGHKMSMPFWGPGITDQRIAEALKGFDNLSIVRHANEGSMLEDAAERLERGEILGWCQGRMEFGPRALGARSIIADPRGADMRTKINALVKKREDFRPFAPAVIAEEASRYFDIEEGDTSLFEYMLCVTQVRPEFRSLLPAITHVNGSARVQTVAEQSNEKFWRLLKAFGEKSGLPMTLNTSFNVRGQPVVCSEVEAVQTFLDADLDALVINHYVITRSP